MISNQSRGTSDPFRPTDRAGDEHVWRLTGHRTLKVRATGVEKVLGLAFRGGKSYALEMSTTAGAPTPGDRGDRTGQPTRSTRDGRLGFDVPDRHDSRPGRSVLRLQPGFGFGAGQGQILRIQA